MRLTKNCPKENRAEKSGKRKTDGAGRKNGSVSGGGNSFSVHTGIALIAEKLDKLLAGDVPVSLAGSLEFPVHGIFTVPFNFLLINLSVAELLKYFDFVLIKNKLFAFKFIVQNKKDNAGEPDAPHDMNQKVEYGFTVNRKGDANSGKIKNKSEPHYLWIYHHDNTDKKESRKIIKKKSLLKSNQKNKYDGIDKIEIRKTFPLKKHNKRNVDEIYHNHNPIPNRKSLFYPFPDIKPGHYTGKDTREQHKMVIDKFRERIRFHILYPLGVSNTVPQKHFLFLAQNPKKDLD